MLTYIRQVYQIKPMRKRSVTIQTDDKKEKESARHMHNQWLKLAQILDKTRLLFFSLPASLSPGISASLSSTACWEYANRSISIAKSELWAYASYTSCCCLCVQKIKYVYTYCICKDLLGYFSFCSAYIGQVRNIEI